MISHTSGWTPQVSQSEVNFTMEKISKVPKNESSWNYLRVSDFVRIEGRKKLPKIIFNQPISPWSENVFRLKIGGKGGVTLGVE